MALVDITGDRLFASVLQTIFDNMSQYHDKYTPKEEWIMRLMYRQLSEIAEAVQRGQVEKARSLAVNHTNQFNELAKTNQ
jgi:DNA-binding FadR family transcriptional regulator